MLQVQQGLQDQGPVRTPGSALGPTRAARPPRRPWRPRRRRAPRRGRGRSSSTSRTCRTRPRTSRPKALCATRTALDATGARLALQPPDVSLRVAKKLGLQDPAVSALDRFKWLKIVQALPSDPANASTPFWCNACSSVLTALRAKSGGAVQASAILRHLLSKHNLYLRAPRRPDGAPQPPHCAQGEPLPADGPTTWRASETRRGAQATPTRRRDGLRLLRHRRRNAESSTKLSTWTRTSAGSAAQCTK